MEDRLQEQSESFQSCLSPSASATARQHLSSKPECRTYHPQKAPNKLQQLRAAHGDLLLGLRLGRSQRLHALHWLYNGRLFWSSDRGINDSRYRQQATARCTAFPRGVHSTRKGSFCKRADKQRSKLLSAHSPLCQTLEDAEMVQLTLLVALQAVPAGCCLDTLRLARSGLHA